ncbi:MULTISPECIES: hypothetical protein [Pseudomonas]|uniref:Uncharacterized protein n=1 Tax=Pseudomonas kribbensis TaxID=1628086 RepID=A0A4Y8VP86_9PSED|nr:MULTISPECIES: hypothetical protein [Pseudomonas]TFH82382.1 hypothetical protein E4J90_06690 [Pseudomonas kribbensis]
MLLSHQLQSLASDAASLSAGTAIRCATANHRWEDAVSDERASEYSVYVGDVTTHTDWKAEHKSYLGSFVHVPLDLPRSAETFMAVNSRAHLSEQLDNTYLLRLESLGFLFDNPLISGISTNFWQRFFNSQKDLRKDTLSDSDEALRIEFMAQWNTQRTQARPLFATFLNDFGGDLAGLIKDDWPHLLRDRLGLTHWPSSSNQALPVALMCYTLDDVRQARSMATKKGAVASFTRPTVLDAEMSAAFIPAPLQPGGESYGYTLDLANHSAVPETFTPELLTFPIEYQPRHIKALGFISSEHALLEDEAIFDARNRHVQGLQKLSGCDRFGEVLA